MNLLYYLRYAARNLWRSRRWSTFAIFSVAAGVATVVALRSLGLAIGDALTSNVRGSNRGDITLVLESNIFFSFGDPDARAAFTPAQIDRVRRWAQERGGRATAYTTTGNIQISSQDYVTAGRPQFITSIFIDPRTFPPTDDLFTLDPPGARLGDLFTGGNEVVISQNLAASQNIRVGDRVRVSGTTEEFTVKGIIATDVQAGLRDMIAAFFGFAFFSLDSAAVLPAPENPNTISLTLADNTPPETVTQLARQLSALVADADGPAPRFVRTVPDLLRENQNLTDVLGSFIVVLGLGALLLGGVGIINTMLVMVGRRTEEIAALKTFGLKARQIAAMFLAEAFLMGLAGSLLGSVFGVLLSSLANAYGQMLIQQPLVWRVYPEAILFGLALGMVVTLVFGVLPVLTAVRVRPNIILRPNETHIPRAGCLSSLFALLFVVLAVGLIAGQMLAPAFRVARGQLINAYITGIIGVAVTLLILGLLIGLLWVVVWLIGKLPSFGSVDLRLALRNLATRRTRTATTLLALSAGMFALSSISFFGAGMREIVQFTLSEAFGGNVLIFPVLPPILANPLIDSKLNSLEGVEYRTRFMQFQGEIKWVDGVSLADRGALSQAEVERQIREAGRQRDFERVQRLAAEFDLRPYVQVVIRDTNNPNLTSGELTAGRDITPADRGQRVAVVKLKPAVQRLNLAVGSTIGVQINDQVYDFEVVGLMPDVEDTGSIQSSIVFGDVIIPAGSLERVTPNFQITVAQIQPEHLNRGLVELSALPLVFSFDISFIDGMLSRFISQMSAIPILVGLLSLLAAAVIMTNTVALSMLERRRQIGILKAVGLKGRRVLSVMLLENTLVSLLGGLLGIGLSSLGVALMTRFGLNVTMLVPTDALPIAIALVIAAIVIAWTATLLSARAILGERVTNVLRYE